MTIYFADPRDSTKVLSSEEVHVRMSAGVVDLRPAALSEEKLNEDRIHHANEASEISALIWELLDKKSGFIRQFKTLWLPRIAPWLQRGTSFVEIGGGLSYVASIVKNRFPELSVVASDISPTYLRRKAIPLASLLGQYQPDWFVALDAETLPFRDHSVDVLWCNSMMHHLEFPERFIREAQRVLTPNGLLCAVDSAVPLVLRKRYLSERHARGGEHGIHERVLSIVDWMRLGRQVGLRPHYAESARLRGQLLNMLANLFISRWIVLSNAPRSVSRLAL